MDMMIVTCQNPECPQQGVEIDAPAFVHVGHALMFAAPAYLCTACHWAMPAMPARPVEVKMTIEEANKVYSVLGGSPDPDVMAVHDRLFAAVGRLLP